MTKKSNITILGLLLLLLSLVVSIPTVFGYQLAQVGFIKPVITNGAELKSHNTIRSAILQTEPHIYWNRTHGGTNEEIIYAGVECRDGGFAVTGFIDTGQPNWQQDVYLARIDPWGNLLWQKSYGGDESEYANALVECNDGGFIMVGKTTSFGIGWPGDIYVIRTDNMGHLLWNQTIGGNEGESASAITVVGDNIYVLGETESFGIGDRNIYLLCFDTTGTLLWSKTYGSNGTITTGESLVSLSNNGLIIGYGVSNRTTPEWDESVGLIKITNDGSQLWNRTYKASPTSQYPWAFASMRKYAPSVIECDDEGFILISTMIRPGAPTHFSYMDAWLLHTDSSGSPIWNRTYTGIGVFDGGFSVVQCNNSDFVILYNYDDQPWLMRTDSFGNPLWNMTLDNLNHPIANMLVNCLDGGYVIVGWVPVERQELLPDGSIQMISETDIWILRLGYGNLPPQPLLGFPLEIIIVLVIIIMISVIVGWGVIFVLRRSRRS